MLRVRRGVGPPAGLAHICRPCLRCPRQCTPLRSYVTETDPDGATKPLSTPQTGSEDILKRLNASSAKLQTRINKLEKEAKEARERNAARAQKTASKNGERTPKDSTTSDDNFNEALDVVRRVYGVDKPKKTSKKKKGPKPGDPLAQDPSNTQGALKGSDTAETNSQTVGEQAGMWTSLRERLQKDQAAKPLNAAQEQLSASSPVEPLTKKAKRAKKADMRPVETFMPGKLKLEPVEQHMAKEVPKLAYNLDKILFHSGPYQLQDKRTNVYNFDPYLGSIMPVQEFDFNALKEYVTSSKDNRLMDLSAKHGKKYCGSTSSMTAMLSHFHFLLSAWRKPKFDHLSRSFDVEFETFTLLTRGPAAAFARYKDGVYAIDADKEFDNASILSMLGKSMEKLLTLPKGKFEQYRRSNSHELSEEEKNTEEAFHYTTLGDFMMRSQLDAHDPRLPGSGMFDLKTRAVVTIRMDVGDYEKGVGYEIRNRFGTWESFEREYYDMIRAAFLKYSLQVRMGRMDGIFVAFHNTQRIFGFQYISIEEMDRALHGTTDRKVGDEEFKASIKLLNELLERASKRFPGKSLRLHIETRPTNPTLTYFFAEPVTDTQMQKTQDKGKAAVDKLEKQLLGISHEIKAEETTLKDELISQVENEPEDVEDSQGSPSVEESQRQRQRAWDEMMAKVDHTVENDAAGLESVREAIEQALEQSGLLAGKSELERNAYLNELVEALTEELEDGKEVSKESEDVLQKDSVVEDSHDAEEASETSAEVKPSLQVEALLPQSNDASEGNSPITDVVSEDVVSNEATAQNPTEANEARPEDGAKERDASIGKVGDAAGGSAATSTDSILAADSLKDLILRVAQGVDNKASSLGTFERVLSGLVRDQKQLNSEIDEINVADVDTIPTETIKSSETDNKSSSTEEAAPTQEASRPDKEILGMYVTVRNKVNGEVVKRVDRLGGQMNHQWTVEYAITELPPDRAEKILKQVKNRRRKVLATDPEQRTRSWHKLWGGSLVERTEAGRRYRKEVMRNERSEGVRVAWDLSAIKKRPSVKKQKNKAENLTADRDGSNRKDRSRNKKKFSKKEKDSSEEEGSSEKGSSEKKD